MIITLPEIDMSEQEIKQELAISLFQHDRVTLAKAAEIADVSRLDFQRLLAQRAIPVHYSVDDFEDDLRGLNG
jgi:predicted HTH domain antitoxin